MRRIFPVLLALLACPTVRADLIDPDVRFVKPRMAFPGVEKHPDHVFLLRVSDRSHWGPWAEPVEHVIPIAGPAPFTLDVRPYIGQMTVLAVPRHAFEELDEGARAEITADTAGVLSCDVKPPATSRHVSDPEPGVARHRITIADGKLVAEPAAEPEDTDSSATGWPGRRFRAGWGVALAASFAWLGIALGRRLRRTER